MTYLDLVALIALVGSVIALAGVAILRRLLWETPRRPACG
jgi:hypothetical protein